MGTAALLIALIAELAIAYVCWEKGKPWFALLGLVTPVFSIIGAVRLAKPDSDWAYTRYGEHAMAEATRRFPKSADNLESREATGRRRPPLAPKG